MQSKYWKSTAPLLLTAVVGICSANVAHAEDRGNKLQGSWLFQITLQKCATGTPIGTPFFSLLTFTAGGTVAETTSNPMFFPSVRGPGHGIWEKSGPHTYKAATLAMITLDGVLTTAQTIDQTIEVDGDTSKTAAASVKFYKPDGTLLREGCATAVGSRMELSEFE